MSADPKTFLSSLREINCSDKDGRVILLSKSIYAVNTILDHIKEVAEGVSKSQFNSIIWEKWDLGCRNKHEAKMECSENFTLQTKLEDKFSKNDFTTLQSKYLDDDGLNTIWDVTLSFYRFYPSGYEVAPERQQKNHVKNDLKNGGDLVADSLAASQNDWRLKPQLEAGLELSTSQLPVRTLPVSGKANVSGKLDGDIHQNTSESNKLVETTRNSFESHSETDVITTVVQRTEDVYIYIKIIADINLSFIFLGFNVPDREGHAYYKIGTITYQDVKQSKYEYPKQAEPIHKDDKPVKRRHKPTNRPKKPLDPKCH